MTEARSKHGDVDKYLYDNYAYRLFLKEFTYLVKENGDKETRKELGNIFSKTKINKKHLYSTLRKYPQDYKFIIEYAHKYSSQALHGILRTTTFDFDRVLLSKLLDMPMGTRKEEIRKLMDNRVMITKDEIRMSNVHVSCSKKDQVQCKEGKLLMYKDEYENCISYLARDISIPYRYSIISIMTSGIVNPLLFTHRPHERLKIEAII